MRLFTKTAIAAILLLDLSGCSTAGSLFSYDSGASGDTDADNSARAAVETSASAPTNDSCAKVATQRADDAVLALYVSEGSPEQQKVYRTTYRECVAWHHR